MERIRERLGQWKTKVQSGQLPPVVIIVGDADTFARTAMDLLVKTAFKKGDKGLNFHVFDGKSSAPPEWLMNARTAPMLAQQRVVHVTEADPWLKTSTAGGNEVLDQLLDFAGQDKSRGTIVLQGKAFDKKSPLVRRIEELDGLYSFALDKKQASVQEFIRGLFRKRGISADRAAVNFLADALGNATDAIVSEVKKLSEYAGESGVLTLEDAKEMVRRLRGHQFYELSRAVAERNCSQALAILDRMYDMLVDARKKVSMAGLPLILLSYLEGEFWNLAVAKGIGPKGSAKDLAAKLSIRRKRPVQDFVAQKTAANARRFTEQELEDALSGIREVDKKLKSTSLPSRLLMEDLIISICSKSR